MLPKVKAFQSAIHLRSPAQPKGCTESPSRISENTEIQKVTNPMGTKVPTAANRGWLGHTAVTHSQEVAGPCRALVLSQIKTQAWLLPGRLLRSAATPRGSSRSAAL